jgi:D-alanine-D-alanine ligase
MKIAVVHNTEKAGTIYRFGKPCPEDYGKKTIQMVIDALEAEGHLVASVSGDKNLFAQLECFMPPDPQDCDRRPTGMVFNMAYGIQGECRYTHVPAMLEMAGVPYSGSSPLGHALALDKVITKHLIQAAGVPTPAFKVLACPGQSIDGLRYPLIVKPRHESTSFGLRLVRNRVDLDEAVSAIVSQYQQEALVEEYIDGREVCIGLLGNDPPEFLPPVELDFGERPLRLMTWDDKHHQRADEPTKICPAPLDPGFLAELNALALSTFNACHCKDYARVDIRIDSLGRPFVLEINSMASLGEGGSFVKAAVTAGYSYAALVRRIAEVTSQRYFGVVSQKPEFERTSSAPLANFPARDFASAFTSNLATR